MKKYCCYQITNKINGKFYRGKSTVARIKAGYFGSGLRLWEAISKYGKENFSLEILKTFDSEEEAFEYEKEVVVLDLQKSYNLKPGGKGGKQALIWLHKNGKQVRVDPKLEAALLLEGYERGQTPGHLDNFRRASTAPEVQKRRESTRQKSGAIEEWSRLMRTPEIRKKAAEHSVESRKKSGLFQKWLEAGRSLESRQKQQEKRNRKKTIVRTEDFKVWYEGKKVKYNNRPFKAVPDYLLAVGKVLEDFVEYGK